MDDWPIKKIGNIAKIKGGKRLPKGEQLTTDKTEHPYIRAQDIRNKRITFDDPHYIREDIYKKIERYTVEEDDVVLTIVGAGIGEIGIIPKKLGGANLTENAVKLVNLRDLDPQYLFYSLLDEQAQNQIYNLAAGAAQPKLGIYKVKRIGISYPDLSTQQKIASILSAFDDLIENNSRRIEILEEMARRIYREWFVHFRYPGHENDDPSTSSGQRLVDSGTELGEIPEGWEVKTFNKLFDISYGKTLPMKDFVEDGEYLVYGAGDVVGRYSKKNIDEKHTLITCRGNGSGAVWRTRDEGFVTNNSLILFPKHDYLSYYFNYHLANNSNMKSVITGSAQPQITITNLSFLKSVFAPKEIIDSFNEKVKAIYDQIDLIFESNKKLKETRDLLLPKLISGKIDVGEMELAI